jgi:CheY-like chemotaxis protein
MVVEDESAIRALQCRLLNDAGYSVIDAEDGPAAIALLAGAVQPDLVVADLQMPGMNGQEMARRLRALLPRLKVLFVTGHADGLFGVNSALGADEAYLEKPFTRAGLIEAVSLLIYGDLRSLTPGPARARSLSETSTGL